MGLAGIGPSFGSGDHDLLDSGLLRFEDWPVQPWAFLLNSESV
jgi:hypothetical protein